MNRSSTALWTVWTAFALSAMFAAAQPATPGASEVHARIQVPVALHKDPAPAAVVWLSPIDSSRGVHPPSPGHFTLLQKNRTFSPHMLVVPSGSAVSFPNADPFFHNVFSLFNGKRFDLGLYEAGASKDVVFSREGVSYIFCNIHPEMSAVILTLATPLYGVANASQIVNIQNVPPGAYSLHVWIEGLMQPALDRMTRRVQVRAGTANTFVLDATDAPQNSLRHLNKFGQPYAPQERPPY